MSSSLQPVLRHILSSIAHSTSSPASSCYLILASSTRSVCRALSCSPLAACACCCTGVGSGCLHWSVKRESHSRRSCRRHLVHYLPQTCLSICPSCIQARSTSWPSSPLAAIGGLLNCSVERLSSAFARTQSFLQSSMCTACSIALSILVAI